MGIGQYFGKYWFYVIFQSLTQRLHKVCACFRAQHYFYASQVELGTAHPQLIQFVITVSSMALDTDTITHYYIQ